LFRSTTGHSALNGAFGERALAAESGGGGRFAREARNEFHEQLGQFLVVDGIVDGQRRQPDLGIGRTVPAPREHRVHREVDRLAFGNLALQPRGDFRQIRFARILRSGRFCR
jgi:hypothetical protein